MQCLRNSVATRSNVGVEQCNNYLSFSSTEKQIFLRTSKICARQRRLSTLDASAVKIPATPVTFVDCCAELRLAENTELLVNQIK